MGHTVSLTAQLVAGVGQQSQMAGALDGNRQLPLMAGAGASDTAGNNLCSLADVSSQAGYILVVDLLNAIHAEGTNFFSAFSAAASIISLHNGKPPFWNGWRGLPPRSSFN